MKRSNQPSESWQDNNGWWERTDKAYVWKSEKPNDYLIWMAFYGPLRPLLKATRRMARIPRKWGTAVAAMKAIDKEVPLS